MSASVETVSALERRLTVAVPATQIDSAVESRLLEAQKTLRVDGFRPGKVPMREVKRRFGSGVRNEVLGEVMRDQFLKAVTEQKIEPAGMPSFEPVKNVAGEDLEFVALFEVFPEVKLADFSSISVEEPESDVTDADVDTMIENLRRQRATWKEVARAAQNGDRVNLDYQGLKGGEAFAGGSAQEQTLTLGSGSMIPGFEDGLVGLSAGEQKTLELTFPEDYHAEELKGQAVQFNVTLNKVEEQELPALDAEFMTAFGVLDGNLDQLKIDIRKNMERELRNAVRGRVKTQVMDALVASHDLDVPKALVSGEVGRLRQQMFQQFGGAKIDPSMLPDELFREQAERSVKLGLIVREILQQHNVKVDEDKVRARVEEIAEQYEQPAEVVQWFYGNREQLEQVQGGVLEDQVVELVLASAQVSKVAQNYQEVVGNDR